MSRAERLPHWVYRLFHLPGRLYRFGLGQKVGPPILILTTTGRKSGLPRRTPLQYELLDGVYYVGSMRGTQADWFRNLVADPRVTLQVGERTLAAQAQAITDTDAVLAFLTTRLQRSPRMISAIMRADGLDDPSNQESLRAYAKNIAVAAFRPLPAGNGRSPHDWPDK